MPVLLWVDDQIDVLKPHVRLLETKGYDVVTVTNGADAIARVRMHVPDLVLLDEQMPGMGGLETLEAIKQIAPQVPVVMVTKSEEEHLMEEALGAQIADYLTKPVNPSQILLTVKRLLERQRIEGVHAQQQYLQQFSDLSQRMGDALSPDEWVQVYLELVRHSLRLDSEEGVRQVLDDQFREANRAFGKYVEKQYPAWIKGTGSEGQRPLLSHEVLPKHVLPLVRQQAGPVVLLVIDCMRYDQWLEMERLLYGLFDVERNFYFSLLPTATGFARNALFSGLLPRDLARRYPNHWHGTTDSEDESMNAHEAFFLDELLKRSHLGQIKHRYDKVVSTRDGREFATNVNDILRADLSAVVVNFVDILAHTRSDSSVLREIAPDERAYRALTRTWFEHSWLLEAFKALARSSATIIVTTDHGVMRCLHPTKVMGDRETSTALRFKHGRMVRADERHAIVVKEPEAYGLPKLSINENYIIAKEDYYFVYPTNYHHYAHLYRDSLQHGGVSLEEMIVPLMTLRPRP